MSVALRWDRLRRPGVVGAERTRRCPPGTAEHARDRAFTKMEAAKPPPRGTAHAPTHACTHVSPTDLRPTHGRECRHSRVAAHLLDGLSRARPSQGLPCCPVGSAEPTRSGAVMPEEVRRARVSRDHPAVQSAPRGRPASACSIRRGRSRPGRGGSWPSPTPSWSRRPQLACAPLAPHRTPLGQSPDDCHPRSARPRHERSARSCLQHPRGPSHSRLPVRPRLSEPPNPQIHTCRFPFGKPAGCHRGGGASADNDRQGDACRVAKPPRRRRRAPRRMVGPVSVLPTARASCT